MLSCRLRSPRYGSIGPNEKKSTKNKRTYKISDLDENILNEINSDFGTRSSLNNGKRSSQESGKRSSQESGKRSSLNIGKRSSLNIGKRSSLNNGTRSSLNNGKRSSQEISTRSSQEISTRSSQEISTINNIKSQETIIDSCINRFELTTLKTGASSIILGRNHYKEYFQYKSGKLLKVTNINSRHNDLKFIPLIHNIKNNQKFYAITDSDMTIINPGDTFYEHLFQLVRKHEMDIFKNNLYVFYIDFAGEMDVLDSLDYLKLQGDTRVWRNYSSIFKFIKHILLGLYYLHQNKICHLDIKPENIMISLKGKYPHFRIIDFGFASIEPFDDFITNVRGTPEYFPRDFEQEPSEGLPRIIANDLEKINGYIPFVNNRKLIYKIDSFTLGRVLQLIYYYFLNNYTNNCNCFNISKNKNDRKVKNIISKLTYWDVYERPTITDMVRLLYVIFDDNI